MFLITGFTIYNIYLIFYHIIYIYHICVYICALRCRINGEGLGGQIENKYTNFLGHNLGQFWQINKRG